MILSNLKRFLSIVLVLILLQNSKESVEFTVDKLEKMSVLACRTSLATYSFSIKGTFSDSTSLTDSFTLNMETSTGNKIDGKCTPIQSLGVYSFSCSIDVAKYPLDNVDILLPTTAPQTTQYTFKNWDTVIGAQPGVSNKIDSVSCSVTAQDTFTPTSITLDDCTFDNKRRFNINGNWGLANSVSKTNYGTTDIVLDNQNQDTAKCVYYSESNQFKCEVVVGGLLNIKEQYVQILLNSYKISAFNSGETAKDCDDDDDEYINSISATNYLTLLNKYFLLICLLLF